MLVRDAERYVVVDVETTGVYNSDRVVEVAAVTLSRDGRIIDEWDTLVNPERDVGPTYLHGVSASMVSAAPVFSEVAGVLGERLAGGILVAHNLPFDQRMLTNEYQWAGGGLDPGVGICTLNMSGEKLAEACRRRGIVNNYPHRALADARATGQLLMSAVGDLQGRQVAPVTVHVPPGPSMHRTLRREAHHEGVEEMPYLARLADASLLLVDEGGALAYLDLLDWVISDLVVTADERSQLVGLATDLGLSPGEVADLHWRYLDGLVAASLRDGVVDDAELEILLKAAEGLEVESRVVVDRVSAFRVESNDFRLAPGTRVCFTGSAVFPDGSPLPRSTLDAIATGLGLESVGNVTKKGCDLLVAADPSSQSGKTRKARKYEIPIASASDFLLAPDNGGVVTTV